MNVLAPMAKTYAAMNAKGTSGLARLASTQPAPTAPIAKAV
jgi:hypothetical protein